MLKLVHKHYYASKGNIRPKNISHISARKLTFIQALQFKDRWQPNDLITVMKSFINLENNTLDYNTITSKIGTISMDAMIEANLFHLRPCPAFESDLDSTKFPLVTLHAPYDILIIKQLLHGQSQEQ